MFDPRPFFLLVLFLSGPSFLILPARSDECLQKLAEFETQVERTKYTCVPYLNPSKGELNSFRWSLQFCAACRDFYNVTVEQVEWHKTHPQCSSAVGNYRQWLKNARNMIYWTQKGCRY
jgi:hypothetical protein